MNLFSLESSNNPRRLLYPGALAKPGNLPAPAPASLRAPTCRQERKKILFVGDLLLVAECVKLVIDQSLDLEVCGCSPIGPHALKSVILSPPDVVILSLDPEPAPACALLQAFEALDPCVPVLAMAGNAKPSYRRRASVWGARGYLSMSEAVENLLGAIRAVAGGGSYWPKNRFGKPQITNHPRRHTPWVQPKVTHESQEFRLYAD